MCLAIPGRVEELQGRFGVVNFGGVRRKVDFSLLQRCKVGDYVIVHAGFAIEKFDEDEAVKTLKLFQELADQNALS